VRSNCDSTTNSRAYPVVGKPTADDNVQRGLTMANEENLQRYGNERPAPTNEEAVKAGRLGGIASGETRREQGRLRKAAETLLRATVTGDNKAVLLAAGYSEEELNNYSLMTLGIVQKAIKGDVQAYNSVRDIIGESPTQKVELEDNRETAERYEFYSAQAKRGAIKNEQGLHQEEPPKGAQVQ